MGRSLSASVLLVLTLTACAADESDVDWSAYSPSVKTTVEKQVAAKDCAGLQESFDSADSHGSTDLMTYLHQALKDADCY